ncbi:MAG: Cof-type HAD-IIB family hydrolase [Clostridia bacterium]|nr:Cof-type HAD-IIB family hydrolase [Clostridia bacterium]
MKYDLLISDYDGTLGDCLEIIEKETLIKIQEFINKGGKFAISTGRPFQSIKRIMEKHNLSGIVGCLQGAEVRDTLTGKQIHIQNIDDLTAINIINKMKSENLSPCLFDKNALYYERLSEYAQRYIEMGCIDCIKIKSLVNFIKENPNSVLKIVANCEQEKISENVEKYQKIFGEYALFNSGADGLFETVNAKSSKGKSVEIIANYYNIPLEKVITIGDSTNDIDLVNGKWFGVAVGDGSEQLKKHAKAISEDYKNQPVKNVLEKYCLKN